MSFVFLSYPTGDVQFARRLAEDLRLGGHRAVVLGDLEHEARDQGISPEARRSEAIASADFFLPIISQGSENSPELSRDLNRALDLEAPLGQVTILPALRERCVLPEILGLRLPVDFSNSYATGLHDLRDRISAPTRMHFLRGLKPARWVDNRNVAKELTRYGDQFWDLPPKRFETLVAQAYRNQGCHVEHARYLRKGDIDFVVVLGSGSDQKHLFVQCKRYARAGRMQVENLHSLFPIDIKHGEAHVVTTGSFVSRRAPRSIRFTCGRWDLDPSDLRSMSNWIAPMLAFGEIPADLDAQARDRYSALVDKRYSSSLSEEEQSEMAGLEKYLDQSEAKFYGPIKSKLESILTKLRQES